MVLKREQFNLKLIGTKNFGAKGLLFTFISILLITDLTILLDVPVLRVIFGFLCFTIVPGTLILFVLKLNRLGITEKFVLSIGLSISFLMLFGLLMDKLYFSLGYTTPLSTVSLLVTFNVTMIILCAISYKTNREAFSVAIPNFNLSTAEKAFLIVPIFFPALSIFGMQVMNTTDNNIILMFLLFLIPIYVVLVCLFNHKFPKRLYPVVIFLIGISLLLLLSLRSNHLIGWDVHAEYRFFITVLENLHWNIRGDKLIDACLAISLLPTIYHSILNTNTEYLFKIFYSAIYSISPLAVYILSKRYVGESYGFLASCFFMFQKNFFDTALNARTNTAILFFALAMMVLFNNRIDPLKKRILFIVFMTSCMLSHYSTTYIFFFIMLGSFVVLEILSKIYTFKKVISLTVVLIFFSMIFFWYSQVTKTAFSASLIYIGDSFRSLHELFILEARDETVQAMLGAEIAQKYIPHRIEFVFTWLVFALIGIGVITMIVRYKQMSFPELKSKKADFLREKFEITYFVIALVCVGLLVAMIVVPHIAQGYTLKRLYTIVIIILSVFFVIGGIIISKILSFLLKKKHLVRKQKDERKAVIVKGEKNTSQAWAYLVILLVLIPHFFCVTGVMYNIFGVPRAIILNSEGWIYDSCYIHDQQLIAGEWSSSSEVVEGRLVNKQKTIGNMTEYMNMFNEKSRIHDNGGSEVWI